MTRDTGPAATTGTDRRLPAALVVVLLLFATGVWTRPDGTTWAVAYDLVLYNAVYGLAAVWAWRSAPRWSVAGRWLGIGLVLNAGGNVVYTVQEAAQMAAPTPSAADLLCLAFYPFLYVAIVKAVRSRAPRFHARMWLDGLIGASGAAAVAIAVLLAPALAGVGGGLAEYATNLAFPVADVLLLALVVGLGGALGLRTDRAMLTVCAGLALHLVGDVVYLNQQAADRYVEGGPLDLTWLVGVACVAWGVQPSLVAARTARTATRRDLVEWRVVVVPVGCSTASVALLAAGWGDRLPVSVACCAVACLVTVVVRTVLTFREMRRLRDVGREARTDDLTGLPNRRALYERLQGDLPAATTERPLTLLLLDLDGFKQVNDRHGHGAGDELLRQVGARLVGALRPSDTVARLGGDEFAVVLPDTGVDRAGRVALRLRAVLDRPFAVGDDELRVGGSIGVATGGGATGTVDDLVRRADDAMYVAKDSEHGDRVHVDGDGAGRDETHREGAALHAALTSGDVAVDLWPRTSLADGRTVGVHAVGRWVPVGRGVLADRAVPTGRGVLAGPDLHAHAARVGLHGPLTETLLDLALAAAARWWSERPPLPVTVALAAADVTDPGLPDVVRAALTRHGLPPRALTLEVAEDCLAHEVAATVLAGLRDLGVAVSVGGVGGGAGSLLLLRRHPADQLALHPDLVADVATDPRAAAVVRHTVALAHALGSRVVAEGVEDGAFLPALAAMGCDAAAGPGVGAALPVEELVTWLRGRTEDRLVPVTSVVRARAVPRQLAAVGAAG